jgi:hypothetical protein
VKARWQASFERTAEAHSLQCGEAKVAFSPVPSEEAKRLLAKAAFFGPRWQRRIHAVARDDEGTFWLVDRAREPERSDDFRLFSGRKGRAAPVELEDALLDEGGDVFLTPRGRLRIDHRKREAEWIDDAGTRKLVHLDVESQAAFVYGSYGAYGSEPLGSACDGRLP